MTDSSPAASPSSLKIYFRLLGYVRPYISLFLISIVGFLIFASTQPMLGYILKYFVDGLSNPEAVLFPTVPYLRDLQLLQAVPLLIILIAAWQGLGSYLGNYFLAKVSLGLVHDLRVQLFNNLLVLPNRYFDKHNSGHLISRITFNVTMVTGAATDAIKVVIREGMTVIFLFASLLFMNWKLTLVMVAILPLIAVMVRTASKKFRKQSKKIQLAMGDVTHVASETIQGYRVVRSFGGEVYEEKRFLKASQSNTDKQLRMTRTGAIYTPMLQLVIYSAMAVLMFLVLYLRGDASAGDMVAYITLAGLLPKPIRQLSEVSSTIQKGVAGAESIFEQLDEDVEIDRGTIERDKVSGRLDMALGLGIQRRGSLIQNQQRGVLEQCAGNCQTLALAAGKQHAVLANLSVQALWQLLDKVHRVSITGGFFDVGTRGTRQITVGNVVGHGIAEQGHMLSHLGDMTAQVKQTVILNFNAIEQNFARSVMIETRNQVSQCRLATTGTPHQCHHLPRFGREGHVLEHLPVGVRVGEAQVAHIQTAGDVVAFNSASIDFRFLIQLLKDAFGTRHALLDSRADFRQLTNRLG